MENNLSLVAMIALLALFFLPSIMAGIRMHRNGAAISVINLFLGWPLLGEEFGGGFSPALILRSDYMPFLFFVGWVGALVWAVAAKRAV
ncbi:MAG: superinfection immunity protein [Proteobacteria bacterium]|nr:superinfection immunity protein [Pseudomonadota bacterium]